MAEFLFFSNHNFSDKVSSTWTNAHINTSDHGLSHTFKGPRSVADGLTGTTNVLVKSLHVQLELNTLSVSGPPTDKKICIDIRWTWGPSSENLRVYIHSYERLLVLVCEITPVVCPNISDTPHTSKILLTFINVTTHCYWISNNGRWLWNKDDPHQTQISTYIVVCINSTLWLQNMWEIINISKYLKHYVYRAIYSLLHLWSLWFKTPSAPL